MLSIRWCPFPAGEWKARKATQTFSLAASFIFLLALTRDIGSTSKCMYFCKYPKQTFTVIPELFLFLVASKDRVSYNSQIFFLAFVPSLKKKKCHRSGLMARCEIFLILFFSLSLFFVALSTKKDFFLLLWRKQYSRCVNVTRGVTRRGIDL